MALATDQQLTDLLARASHVLIAVRKDWTVDGVASALALKTLAERRGKRADVVIDGFAAPASLAWLPRVAEVQPALRDLQKFVITLDLAKTKINELFYDLEGDKLRIHVTPKDGHFTPADLAGAPSDFKYDLIIIVDTPDYRSLGQPFVDFPDFFYQRPTANLDHDPANERYGNLNLVDITAASVAEVVAAAFRRPGEAPLDEVTATLLLTGLIAKTRSFRSPSVTPRTLDLAAELMAAGANREEIVKHLYSSRSVATLKLWGRALARLKFDPVSRTAWTVLVRQDFIHAGAGEEYLSEVIEELIMNSPEADVAGVIYEKPASEKPEICAIIATERHLSALDLVKGLAPEGSRRLVRLCFPGNDMIAAERQVIASIRRAITGERLDKKPEAIAAQPTVEEVVGQSVEPDVTASEPAQARPAEAAMGSALVDGLAGL
jgi:nanoRNase/pAp phosphatase (c-di-AMP/oligoRNAs hydrolase)